MRPSLGSGRGAERPFKSVFILFSCVFILLSLTFICFHSAVIAFMMVSFARDFFCTIHVKENIAKPQYGEGLIIVDFLPIVDPWQPLQAC